MSLSIILFSHALYLPHPVHVQVLRGCSEFSTLGSVGVVMETRPLETTARVVLGEGRWGAFREARGAPAPAFPPSPGVGVILDMQYILPVYPAPPAPSPGIKTHLPSGDSSDWFTAG